MRKDCLLAAAGPHTCTVLSAVASGAADAVTGQASAHHVRAWRWRGLGGAPYGILLDSSLPTLASQAHSPQGCIQHVGLKHRTYPVLELPCQLDYPVLLR